MFENELIIFMLFMGLLFLRQIYILKQPNKINYAPLMIGIGFIGSLVHFIVHPEYQDVLLLVRESLFPVLFSMILYIIMNILHQNQQSENARDQEEVAKILVSQGKELKEFMTDLESRITRFSQEDRKAQDDVREKFKQDIQALDAIQINQGKFLEKFDDLSMWHSDVSRLFEDFIKIQLPELDNVVHKHIDILRVAEQDHYNQLKGILERAVDSRCNISEDIVELKENLQTMKNMSDSIAQAIVKDTLHQLSGVTKSFENQVISLKSHTEGVATSLYEGENRLNSIKEHSEMIMKQMLLSSNKMNELEDQNSGLHNIYATIKELMVDLEVIKADYVKSQAQLSIIARELKSSEEEQITAMKNQVESLSTSLSQKIDDSLEKLHEHYHIADGDITQSVQLLAKKAQLQKGYNS